MCLPIFLICTFEQISAHQWARLLLSEIGILQADVSLSFFRLSSSGPRQTLQRPAQQLQGPPGLPACLQGDGSAIE